MLTSFAWLAIAGLSQAPAADFQRLLERHRDAPLSQRPVPDLIRAMDLVAEGVRKGLDPVAITGRPPADGSVLDLDQVEVAESARSRDGARMFLVRVGYAARGYLITPKGAMRPAPPPLEWSFRLFGRPLRRGEGGWVVPMEGLQDAGVRTTVRVVWLDPVPGGGWRTSGRWDGIAIYGDRPWFRGSGDQVILRSIDPPKSFFTTAPDHVLGRIDTFVGPRRVKTVLENPALRAVDAALFAAQTARRPNAAQRRMRARLPRPEMLLEWKVRRVDARTEQVVLLFDNGTARFRVQGSRVTMP